MKNLTTTQIFAIILATLGVLGVSTAQLTDLFGAGATKYIVSSANLLTSILGGWLAIISGQGSQIRAVLDMPGVDSVKVNRNANQTLAAIAVDPDQSKIEPTPAAAQVVQATAQGA